MSGGKERGDSGAERRGSRLGGERFTIEFDGQTYPAQAGDSAASALLAAGVRFVNRSIKYRRPRGLVACGPEEPNALLSVGTAPFLIPNVPAPMLRARPGLRLSSQNRWPSLCFDLASVLRLGAGFWGAGFYYKTFMWPSWRTYEGLIRRLAGLGAAPGASNVPRADVLHIDCDVLIAGAGPAGLAAALVAARAGSRVILCEREPVPGGELEFEDAEIDSVPALQWVRRAAEELAERGAKIMTDTAVVSAAAGAALAHHQPPDLGAAATLYRVHARQLVNAMGAIERPIAFIDNDLPGVMLSGAAERLLARYGVHVGADVVLFGNHDRLYATARRLIAGGVPLRLVVDTRAAASSAARQTLVDGGVECLLGHTVVAARGAPELRAIEVAPLARPGQRRRLRCDALLVSGGWSPAVRAAEQPACWQRSLGAGAGLLPLAAVLHSAGLAAAVSGDDGEPRLEPYWRSPADAAGEKRQFVDLQNDVTVADLRQAHAEGFRDIEHVKRYTTLGVGTEQGRTGGVLGAAIFAQIAASTPAAVGTSRARGPYQPVPMGVLSGLRVGPQLRPERRTPLHALHLAEGGALELMGGWMRPRHYAANGADAFAASLVEASRVRTTGGICDASTLGKIEFAGPDAAAFLDGVYLSPASTMEIGRARYQGLLREDGIVLDDGLLLRTGAQRFLATTSSGHLGSVLAHLEFHRDAADRPWRLAITDVTEAWAVIVVAGPRSREALKHALGAEWHATVDTLRHMGFHEKADAAASLRLLRASFCGELGYELHCRPAAAAQLWSRLHAAGLQPFGLEALDVLRVEKGYLTSSELNGQTTPFDVGLAQLLRAGQATVGRDLLERPAFHDSMRPMLVGVRAADGRGKFLGGAQITANATAANSLGYVTSAVYSPALGEWIGLALLARRYCAPGMRVYARDPLRGGDTPLRVTETTHYDPRGERMKA